MTRAPQPVFALPCGLVLRPWRRTDAQVLAGSYGDPGIRHWNRPEPMTPEGAATRIAGWERRWAEEEGAIWAVAHPDGPDGPGDGPVDGPGHGPGHEPGHGPGHEPGHEPGEAVGLIGLGDIDLRGANAEFLYWLLPGGRGRGVMPQAVTAVSRWAFDEVGLHRLRICHSVANPASCAVAVKAGFPLEGTMRGALLHADGWHDEHLHARLATDA
ncbi:GNAT family N-acetyltransferase [Streptomyces sp. NPDC006512]|uniref:GNAT family N-acetyltransferase n=1 Tax=Streptomyces sp. NPDC006512 TaxID=3154307 RepID=UPI0033AFD7F2